ncbi:hypothetical protein [Haloferax sp. ATCC BAA-645]|uniref:hypothetical protein n=1 Tax=Haloferax sp. ATCC BAA-645 TaxID=1227463 RepID=UPI001EF9CC85|nr:hypothetical protein [Haloferax sp. ATCC BAA-645]
MRTDAGELAPIPNPEGPEWRPLYRQLRERRDAIDLTGTVAAERDESGREKSAFGRRVPAATRSTTQQTCV